MINLPFWLLTEIVESGHGINPRPQSRENPISLSFSSCPLNLLIQDVTFEKVIFISAMSLFHP